MRGVKFILSFVLRTAIVVLAALLAVKVPQIIVANCGYMVKSDMGYMWVINFAVAFAVTWFVSRRFVEAGGEKDRLYYAITVGTFIVVTIFCESAIWHPIEVGTILTHGISIEKIAYVGIGIISSSVTVAVERKKRKPPVAKQNNRRK